MRGSECDFEGFILYYFSFAFVYFVVFFMFVERIVEFEWFFRSCGGGGWGDGCGMSRGKEGVGG